MPSQNKSGGFCLKPSKSPSDRKVAVATDKYGLSSMSENLSIVERMTVTIGSEVTWPLE